MLVQVLSMILIQKTLLKQNTIFFTPLVHEIFINKYFRLVIGF